MINTVAVATDGSVTASRAVDEAAELAKRWDAKLVLLSVFSDGSLLPSDPDDPSLELRWASNPAARTQEIVSRTEDSLRRRGLDCSTRLDEGDPAEVIVRLAAECGADVLVIGNKGMHRRVLGSVPNTVTHKAPCSVWVVKTAE
jgi:nucleotide-binding universal stress UspA family protein